MKLFLSTLCLGGAAAAASTGPEQKTATPLAPVADAIETVSSAAPPAANPLLASTSPQDDDDKKELKRAAADLEEELAKLRAELAEMQAKMRAEQGRETAEVRRRGRAEADKVKAEYARTKQRAAEMKARAEAEVARTKVRAERARARYVERQRQAEAEARNVERTGRRIASGVRRDGDLDREEIERVLAEVQEGGAGVVLRRRAREARAAQEELESKLRAVEADVARVRARDARDNAVFGLRRAKAEKEAAQVKKEAIERAQKELRAWNAPEDVEVQTWVQKGDGDDPVVWTTTTRESGGKVQEIQSFGGSGAGVAPKGIVRRLQTGGGSGGGQVIYGTQAPRAPRTSNVPKAAPAPHAPHPQGGGQQPQSIHIEVEEGDVHIHMNGGQVTTTTKSGGGSGGGFTSAPKAGKKVFTGQSYKANPNFDAGGTFRFESKPGSGGTFYLKSDDGEAKGNSVQFFGVDGIEEVEEETHEEKDHGVTILGVPGGKLELDGTTGLGGILSLEIEDIDVDTFGDMEAKFAKVYDLTESGSPFAVDVEVETILEDITEIQGKVLDGTTGLGAILKDIDQKSLNGASKDVEAKVMIIDSKGGEPHTMIFRNGELIEGEMPEGVSVPMLSGLPLLEVLFEEEECEEIIEETEEIEGVEEFEIEFTDEVVEEPGFTFLNEPQPLSPDGQLTQWVMQSNGRTLVRNGQAVSTSLAGGAPADDELIELARDIRNELRLMREELQMLRAEISGQRGARAPRTRGPRSGRADVPGPSAPSAPRAPRTGSGRAFPPAGAAAPARPVAPTAPVAPREPVAPVASGVPVAPSAPDVPGPSAPAPRARRR